jgi:hypothetical protein
MSQEIERWAKRRKDFHDAMSKKFQSYSRFCRWFKSDFSDVANSMGESPEALSVPNLLALVARSFRAHLFFNSPRVVVKPVGVLEADMKRAQKLAKVQTSVVNDIFEETGLYWQGRKLILDGFLAPYMVAKVGYNLDVVVDEDRRRKEREKAERETLQMSQGGRPQARVDDLHSLHIEQHEQLLVGVRRGDFPGIPPEDVKYIEKHVEKHYELKASYGESDEIERGERVFIRRKRPNWVTFDFWAPDISRIRWVTETFIRTLDEVKNDRRYNTNRFKVQASTAPPVENILNDMENAGLRGGDIVILHECIDLQEGVVHTFQDGSDRLLRETAYSYRDILPSGPYVFATFSEDPTDEGIGLPQPGFWESQQRDAALLHTVQVLTGKAASPGMAYDSTIITDEEASNLTSGVLHRLVKVEGLQERKISDAYGPIPQPQVTPDTFAALGNATAMIDRLSGLGAVRLGGGDRSRTATASELVSEAATAMTQESAVLVDRVMNTLARYSLRLAKAYYRPATVRAIAGDLALEVWPEDGFTKGEIFDDRGVEIIPGTMRRVSTDVEIKLLGDLYAAMVRDPAVPVTVRLELLDYLTTLYGAPINIDAAMEAARNAPMMPGMGMPGGGGEAAMSAMLQGKANVGGGRVPTGASAGDRMKVMR